MDKQEFPFKTSLSFRKLIDFWRNAVHTIEGDCPGSDYARRIVKDVEAIPELNGLIYDYSLIERHRPLIDSLMTAVFPVAYLNSNLTAVTAPLDFKTIYSTKKFNELFCDENGYFAHDLSISEEMFDAGKVISLYAGILKMAYGINMTVVFPLIKTIVDSETGLERYYKLNLDDRFIDIKITGELPPVNKEQITLLAENMFNFELWQEILPSSLFEFEGFLVVNMFEVTDQEALSRLKLDLLDKNILSGAGGFASLEKRVRTLFRNPRLRLGIASFTDDSAKVIRVGDYSAYSFIADKNCDENCSDYDRSIYRKAIETGEPQIIFDLSMLPGCTRVENEIMKTGVVNFLVAPLVYEGKIIGIFELGSSNPGDLNAINAMKLLDVLPLFSLALKRSLEDRENKIQAIIKEKCTAVHPSVEWRFRKAAINLLEKEKSDSFANMEEIVFRDVYPLYALSDIRSSSNIRNTAIQHDLCQNLELAKMIIQEASEAKPMPEFHHLIYKIERRMLALSAGLNSGDEAGIVSFLKREIEPLFDNISGYSTRVKECIRNYSAAIDPALGILYSKRKEYEQSVKMLNENISSIVDKEEEYAQSIYPHYFEKYKTDGVEYTMYIGDSISEKERFDMVYLRNLRLWQFILMCKVAAKSEKIKPLLKVPLELAHLILVQNSPLSIRFHLDQKKFDVDGTYNVHYEIMKKRIDKAEIRGKEERLTQPGKIAIVYTQPSEAQEYLQYIEYLQAGEFLKKGVEEMELEDLQGVYGLKALRVTVDTESDVYGDALKSDLEIKELTKS